MFDIESQTHCQEQVDQKQDGELCQARPDIIVANERQVLPNVANERLVTTKRVKQIGIVEAMSKVMVETKMKSKLSMHNCKAIK